MIQRMEQSDVDAVTRIHQRAFPGFFLTFLGPRFLRLLYASIVDEPTGVAFVALGGNGVVEGFVAGVTEQAGFYRKLIRRRVIAFALAAGAAFVRRPSIGARLLRAFSRPSKAAESSAPASLMSISITPGTQSRGLGTALVRAFDEELRQRGVSAYCLTTDRDGNDAANRFYVKLDFVLSRTFVTPEGRRMNEYLMRLE